MDITVYLPDALAEVAKRERLNFSAILREGVTVALDGIEAGSERLVDLRAAFAELPAKLESDEDLAAAFRLARRVRKLRVEVPETSVALRERVVTLGDEIEHACLNG